MRAEAKMAVPMMKMLDGQLARDGYAIVPAVLGGTDIDALISRLARPGAAEPTHHGGEAYAIRNLLSVPEIYALAASPHVRGLIEPLLGRDCFAVRGILFDKTPAANWRVPWHQDLRIAVRARRDIDGFGPWSRKAGVPHVQPPVAVLRGMLTVRLHLDNCDATNGPLLVLPGSHHNGCLSRDAIRQWRAHATAVSCEVPRGGALLMRPLLLHASGPATRPAHRRVVHLEFAAEPLPGGVEWHRAVTGERGAP
jgi:ectoine hydroxylase-related dioxygenase (phytanoyl-CoA dioxygenase family)